jgi:uncharacterized protein
MTKNELINYIRLSLRNLNISKVILFGSWANDMQTDESDVDLLVVTNDEYVFQSFEQKMKTKVKIARALNGIRKFADIDLIVHTRPMFEKFLLMNSGFKNEIINSGKVIYEADN